MIRTLIVLLLLSGCASVKPVMHVELMYAIPISTDYWIHQDQSWTCEPPQARVEFGLQTKNGWEGGAYHESFVLCGTFNTKPEIFENGFYIKKSWGGW